MILRRPNSKDFVADRNSDICGSPIHEKFRGINFREWTFLGVKKGI